MTCISTSLTLNLVLNLRKFISLMISVAYFHNDFSQGAKIGSTFVFFGTFIYTLAGLL
jgi:UDP-xylose/UDP-N-acetylglucosamine transporter B4